MKNPLNTEQAPAKINLFLHVGARRTDGFHDLQSVAVFARAGDVLAFASADELTLAIDGPHAASLGGGDDGGDNLVLRAARLLAQRAGGKRGAAISLTKNLPVASGLGGGSSDAAAALRGLEKLWNEKFSDAALGEIAAQIGSDVPVCLAARPAWMEGRGEVVTPLERMPPLAMLLVNPGVAVSTREVFARLGETTLGARGRAKSFQDTADLLRFLETTANDLEAPARALSPVIGEVLSALHALPGALMTRMSGSGATCFAIFPDEAGAARAAAALREEYPRWWIAATMTAGAGIGESELRATDIGPTPDGI